MTKQKNKRLYKFLENKWLIKILIIIAVVIILFSGTIAYLQAQDSNKIIPNVKIANINVGNTTAKQANLLLSQKIDKILNKEMSFVYNKKIIKLQNSIQSFDDPDINYDLITYDNNQAIKLALTLGHKNSFLQNINDWYNALLGKINISLKSNIKKQEIKKILSSEFSEFIIPPKSAGIKISDNEYVITLDSNGNDIDWEDLFIDLQNKTELLLPININLTLIQKNPSITKNQAEQEINQLTKIIKQEPKLILNWDEDKNKEISWQIIKNWLVWERDKNNKIKISLDKIKLENYLNELKNDINQPALNAKFEIKNGKVLAFQGSKDGKELKIQENVKFIKNNFIKNIYSTDLIITPTKATVATADTNDLGIREIIGTGKSNFARSPRNRRHNIKVGAAALNGLLIAPGEEFSLLKALGKINAASGYLPELVIKGNKTVPEYGGGLCQIGTTTFRATIQSGLPVTARRNHSYRVSYYEPAGTDATIYDPAPDYKFLNDTKNYVLIQTRIEGDELIFDFWGTKDGRQINITKPTIYNITSPPATKYIETTDLKPGQKRCTESAHAGADAKFTYTVIYPDKEKKEKIFSSHYKPWGAVCLVGVEKKEEEAEKNSEENKNVPENETKTPTTNEQTTKVD